MVRALERSKLTAEQWREVESLDREGVPRAEISRIVRRNHGVEITRARLSQVLGAKELRPGDEAQKLNVELTRTEVAELRRIAKAHRWTVISGPLAGEGSIAGLLRAVARGEVHLCRSRRDRRAVATL